jgi:hypothetical protein
VPELLRRQNQIINGFLGKMWFGAIENLHEMGKAPGDTFDWTIWGDDNKVGSSRNVWQCYSSSMRRTEYDESWKRITDTTPFLPLSKLEHRDLSALLFGGILYILYKWSLFFRGNFQLKSRTATVALFRGDSGHALRKWIAKLECP